MAAPGAKDQVAARAPRRIALIVGIGDYKNFTNGGAPGESDLLGPPNDVRVVRALLRGWGFDGHDVRVLTDGAASRDAILASLAWVLTRASDPGDVVVIYFSGHGTYVRDLDGDERRFAPGDEYDEALVAWDAPRGAARGSDTSGLISDDELRSQFIEQLHTRNVTVIIDACYSGTATRGGEGETYQRARGPRLERASGIDVGDARDGGRYTLLSAARATELAQEKAFPSATGGVRVHGVLTEALVQVLRGADRSARWDELLPRILERVRATGADQTPQLEGERESRVFGGGDSLPARDFAMVGPSATGRYKIDRGDLHGVRRGSVLDVYAPGDGFVGTRPLGQLRIDSLQAESAFGRGISGGAPFPAGARAVMAALPLGTGTSERASVWIDPTFHSLAREFDGALFRQVPDSANAQLRVVRDASGRARIVVGDHAIVRDPSERGENAIHPCQIRRAYGAARLLAMPEASADRKRIDVIALLLPGSRTVSAQHLPESPWGSRPSTALILGEQYTLWVYVEAPPGARVFLSAVWAGFTGDLAIAPRTPTPVSVPPNQWLPLDDYEIVEPLGAEIIKVVASSDPFTFSPFMESLPGCHGDGAARGQTRIADSDVAVGWSSFTLRFTLVRPGADSLR
ncbi:MAG: caspase family protein [Gemmatimonadaceae bacterium]